MAKYTGENPWWGLGYLLAQNYNRNYDQRGIEKATEAGSQALEKAKAAIEGTDYAGANAALDKISERYMNAGNALQGYEQAKAIPQGTGQNINLMLQQQPVQYEKMQGITPQRQPITPDYSFNADEFKAKYIKEQQALGRPEHQIQQALAIMEPQIKNLDDQARQLRANETIKQLAGLAPDLNNPDRLKLINALLKDNPELGKAFLTDSITNRDKWKAEKAKELADQIAKNNRELALINNVARMTGNRRNGYSTGSSTNTYSNTRNVNSDGRSGTVKNGNGLNSSQFEYAEKRLAEIKDYEDLNGGLPESLQKEKRNLEYYREQVITENFPDAPYGLQDKPYIDSIIQDAQSKNKSNEEILKSLAGQVEAGNITEDLYATVSKELVYNKPQGPLFDAFMADTQPQENPFNVKQTSNAPNTSTSQKEGQQSGVLNNPSGPLYDSFVKNPQIPPSPFVGKMPVISTNDALFPAINPYDAKYQDTANIGFNFSASRNSDVGKNNPSGPLFDAFMNNSKLENKFTGGTPIMSTKDALYSVLQPTDSNYQQVPEIGNITLNPRRDGLLQEDASSNIVPSRGGTRPDIQALQGVKDMYEADYPYNKDFVYNELQIPKFDINEFRYYKEKPSDHSEMNYYYEEVAANEADSYANEGRNGIHYGNNPIVNRVRDLVGIVPYNDDDGTNCVRTLSIALGDSTPYGGHYHVDQLVNTASQYGDLVTDPDNYIPKPGDIAIVNDGGHAVMVTERGGTIQNGKRKNGVYESARPVESLNGKVKYYITTSRYSDMYR